MGDLTKNFSRWEFACPCCGVIKIDDMLVEGLQEVRDLAGVSIKIHSGFRCAKHNEEVGGAQRSQHLYGKAVDIEFEGLSVPAMYGLSVIVFENGGVGLYPDRGTVHVDKRGVKARWGMIGKEFVTVKQALNRCKEVMA